MTEYVEISALPLPIHFPKEGEMVQPFNYFLFADGRAMEDTLDCSAIQDAYREEVEKEFGVGSKEARHRASSWTIWNYLDSEAFTHEHGRVTLLAGYFYIGRGKGWKACLTDRDYNMVEFAGLSLTDTVMVYNLMNRMARKR